MSDATTFSARRERLRRMLPEHGLDALLVTYETDRYYLSGFELHDPQCNESAGALLIGADGRDWLLTDPRYLDAARRLWDEERIFIYSGGGAGGKDAKIRAFLLDEGPGVIGFSPGAMCVGQHAALTAAKDGARLALKPVSGLVERLRVIKDMDEIARMERSNALNHRVFAMVPELLEPGRTEMDVAWDLEKLFRDNGASELAFPSIVAVGPNGALPHAIPGRDRVLGECPVLVDMGCRLDGYCSDQTRTFWVGEHPTDAFRATLELVQEAQARAIERMRPGEPASGAYKAARDYFARHGVADHFTHSLGHGVGLDTHEAPSANPSNDAPFQPGMVVTAEPGLYYPEWGGVRWEYMVLITETGARVL